MMNVPRAKLAALVMTVVLGGFLRWYSARAFSVIVPREMEPPYYRGEWKDTTRGILDVAAESLNLRRAG